MKVKSLLVTGCMAMMLCATPVMAAGIANNNSTGGSVALDDVNNVMPLTTVTVDNGLGEWRYGTGITGTLQKSAYSDMDHSTKTHKTSCEIDGNKDDSGWVKARSTSKSYTTGPLTSTAYCNWNVK